MRRRSLLTGRDVFVGFHPQMTKCHWFTRAIED
jgi:hypothetical protein